MTAGDLWRYAPPPNVSPGGAGSWTRITPPAPTQQRLPTAQVVTGDPRAFGRVYVGTNGRGVFYGDSPN